MISPSARLRFLLALAGVFLMLPRSSSGAEGFELTAAQHERLRKYLPNTLAKLEKKEPVLALVVGDSVTEMSVRTDDASDTLKSYPGVFLNQLADQFYYTGGLRVMQPKRGKPEKSMNTYGQEIMVQNISRSGRTMIHAMNLLEATVWRDKPDLVLVSFGISDATSRMSLATYRQAVQDVINAVKSKKADLILIGSTPTLKDPPEEGLALTRPYVDTMRDVAQEAGVFFADLGNISWLVRLDEPMKDLELPAPKKLKEDEVEKQKSNAAATPAPPAVIKIPLPEELDPDPDKRAARLFHQVTTNLRHWFDHDGTMDPTQPNTAMHRVLGRHLFMELLDGPNNAPWSMGAATARLIDSDHCEVIYHIENISGATLRLNLLPLVTNNWKPKEAETQVELKTGRKSPVKITYARVGSAPDAFAPHEPLLRLPVMVLANDVAKIEDLRAKLQNFTMLWNLGAQFNQEGGTTVTGRIVNLSPDLLAGKWQAEWLGQKFSGDFKLPAAGEAPVKINIKLPAENAPPSSQRGTLAFTVTTDKLSIQFPRTLEIAQNLGLKQTSPLYEKTQYVTDHPSAAPAPKPAQPGATLKVDADPMALYLTWDIYGLNLVENSNGVAVTADINIDARSYGKRLGHGVTETLRVTSSAADSPGILSPIRPWSFGNGYANAYKQNQAQAILSSRPDGTRRLTLMLPRSIFYLHEWALSNGNSQLGFSTRLGVWQAPDAKHPEGSELSFFLFENGLHVDDAESLAALELTAQPTRRWTAHFY